MKTSTVVRALTFASSCYIIPVIVLAIGISPIYIIPAVAVSALLCWLAGPVVRAVQKHNKYSTLKQELLHDIEEFEKGKR